MTEQTMHNSCSPDHARPLIAVHRTVTDLMSVTSRAAALKVSWSFHAAHSLCVGCDERHLIRVEVVRHVSVVVWLMRDSGHAYPQPVRVSEMGSMFISTVDFLSAALSPLR